MRPWMVSEASTKALGDGSKTPQVLIELVRRPGPKICLGCGRRCEKWHDWEERWVRDLPILDAQTHLCVQRFRVRTAGRGWRN